MTVISARIGSVEVDQDLDDVIDVLHDPQTRRRSASEGTRNHASSGYLTNLSKK